MFSYRAITDEDTHLRRNAVWKLYIYSATAKRVLSMDETWFSARLPTRLRAYFQLEWESDRTRHAVALYAHALNRRHRPRGPVRLHQQVEECFCFFSFFIMKTCCGQQPAAFVSGEWCHTALCLWSAGRLGGWWVMLLFCLLAAWYYRERSNQLLLCLLLYGRYVGS